MATIKLPKHLNGFRFPKAMPFDMNDLSLETILPQVFRLAMLEGRENTRGAATSGDIEKSITELSAHPRLIGFGEAGGKELLGKIVQSSLIKTVRNQKTRKPQIDGLVSYSLASFKAGFPTNRAGFRQVDRFIYELMLEGWKHDPAAVQIALIRTFGTGVEITGYPKPSAARKPGIQEEIDVITELSLSFVDVCDPIEAKRTVSPYLASRPLPQSYAHFGAALHRYLTAYHSRLPIPLLIDQLIAILGFGLSVFTAKSLHALPALVASPSVLPDAMLADSGHRSPPDIYIDLTGNLKGIGRAMAIACVRRDLEQIDPFARAVLKLRYLDTIMVAVKRNPMNKPRIEAALEGKDTPTYLQALLLLLDDAPLAGRIEGQIGTDIDAILSKNRRDHSDQDDEQAIAPDLARFMESESFAELAPVDQLVEILAHCQFKAIRSGIAGKWLRDIGGVGKPWGLINAPSDRRTWCYAPGNDLLSVLVQLRAVDYAGWDAETNPNPQRFGLREFLEWLELRFGVIVDRPPAGLGFDSPEHMAAARENLQAMLRRLRQMGIFEDRSDDFSVQKLTPPFFEPATALVHS